MPKPMAETKPQPGQFFRIIMSSFSTSAVVVGFKVMGRDVHIVLTNGVVVGFRGTVADLLMSFAGNPVTFTVDTTSGNSRLMLHVPDMQPVTMPETPRFPAPERPDVITLSPGQQTAAENVAEWIGADGGFFKLNGFAGTGKTTTVKQVLADINEPMFLAPTNKAARVLSKAVGGASAMTIHSAMCQQPTETIVHDPLTGQPKLDEDGSPVRKQSWEYNPTSAVWDADVLVVDEYTMTNGRMASYIERTGKPVLLLGDPAQLPPVEDYGDRGFAAKSEFKHIPQDVLLTEIHRQADGNPIIEWASEVRYEPGRDDAPALPYRCDGASEVKPGREPKLSDLVSHDVVICYRNETRHALNDRYRREILECTSVFPAPGERVLSGQRGTPGFPNGTFGTVVGPVYVVAIKDGVFRIRTAIKTEFDDLVDFVGTLDNRANVKDDGYGRKRQKSAGIAYAYAITAHKSQGSQFPNVLVMDEMSNWQHASYYDAITHRRWLYTAITRAEQRVTVLRNI